MSKTFVGRLICLGGLTAFALEDARRHTASEASPEISMRAGVAKTVITPDNWKQLTTVMGTKATDKDHEIYARAAGALNDGQSRLVV